VSVQEELKNKIIAEVNRLELAEHEGTKSFYRSLHAPSVRIGLERSRKWILHKYPRYAHYFANGCEVRPEAIQPMLIEVASERDSDLFRLARLTWSLPFTKGYGRRLRFIIMDTSNEKLIGILGLQSPPLDFPARDRMFNYPEGCKVELVNQTMDIYTLGAIPPYSRLLGGKLVALAAASNEVRRAYRRKYEGRTTELYGRVLPAHLVALTTTSAFGRSSLYNRLTYRGRLVAQSIGYTEGYGGFHLATVYPEVREFLESSGVSTRGGFGVGPRIVWQTYVRALGRLGLSSELLKHGIKREVFLIPLIKNLKNYMKSGASRPLYYHHPFDELAAWWRERWLLSRASRVDGWHHWNRTEIERMLTLTEARSDDQL
jgi:hypothetical protein